MAETYDFTSFQNKTTTLLNTNKDALCVFSHLEILYLVAFLFLINWVFNCIRNFIKYLLPSFYSTLVNTFWLILLYVYFEISYSIWNNKELIFTNDTYECSGSSGDTSSGTNWILDGWCSTHITNLTG